MRTSSNLDFAIIGLGRFGSVLARQLEQSGFAVLGIDLDARRVREIADDITAAIIADAADEDALQEVDIAAFGTVIVAIHNDFGATAQIGASLKDLEVEHVIAVADSQRDRDILLRIGIDEVVMPMQDGARQLASRLVIPGLLTTLQLNTNYSVAEILVSSALADTSVAMCETHGVMVAMLIRNDELVLAPAPDTILERQDLLLLVGEQAQLLTFIQSV